MATLTGSFHCGAVTAPHQIEGNKVICNRSTPAVKA